MGGGCRQYACTLVLVRAGENSIAFRPDKCYIPVGLNRRLALDWEKGDVPVCPFCILVKITVCREHEVDEIF